MLLVILRIPVERSIASMVYMIVVHMKAGSDPNNITKLKTKLIETSRLLTKYKETVAWVIMHSVYDSGGFTLWNTTSNSRIRSTTWRTHTKNILINT